MLKNEKKKKKSSLRTPNINDEFKCCHATNTIQCVRADNEKISYKIDTIFSNSISFMLMAMFKCQNYFHTFFICMKTNNPDSLSRLYSFHQQYHQLRNLRKMCCAHNKTAARGGNKHVPISWLQWLGNKQKFRFFHAILYFFTLCRCVLVLPDP